MTSVHRKKLKELMKREERRFIAEHPKSAALYKRAFTWKTEADIDLHTKIFAEAAHELTA